MAEITIRQHNKPGSRGYRYDALLGERVLCVAKEPFCTAARVLLAEGFDPNEPLVLMRKGVPALFSTIGAAAKLRVSETAQGRPTFVKATQIPESWKRPSSA